MDLAPYERRGREREQGKGNKGKGRSGRKKLTWWGEEPITHFRVIFIK